MYRPNRLFFSLSIGLLFASTILVSGCAEDAHAAEEKKLPSPDAKEVEAPKIVDIDLSDATSNKLLFDLPVFMTFHNNDAKALFVVEKYGRIKRLSKGLESTKEEVTSFLDITDRVLTDNNEEGLLALAFHPKYKENGFLYVYYSAGEKTGKKNRWGQEEFKRRSVISRFSRDKKDSTRADPKSEKVLMTIDQPWGNHNGSTLLFGKDGYLYISTGDGGAANDPLDAAQDLSNLLGKVLRIDIDKEEKPNAYAIPKDNPFIKTEAAKPEVWAYGLRNVWRMSFDRESGKLFGGDVGQGEWEEVDIIESGKNYGWRVREGTHAFKESKKTPAGATLVEPIAEYSHKLGYSITGGYVYRGKHHKEMNGTYYYADYVTGRIWGLAEKEGKALANRIVYDTSGRLKKYNISSFAEDQTGEVYAITYHGENSQILKLSPRKAAGNEKK